MDDTEDELKHYKLTVTLEYSGNQDFQPLQASCKIPEEIVRLGTVPNNLAWALYEMGLLFENEVRKNYGKK